MVWTMGERQKVVAEVLPIITNAPEARSRRTNSYIWLGFMPVWLAMLLYLLQVVTSGAVFMHIFMTLGALALTSGAVIAVVLKNVFHVVSFGVLRDLR